MMQKLLYDAKLKKKEKNQKRKFQIKKQIGEFNKEENKRNDE